MAGERGKQQTFTNEQLDALRSAMKEWVQRPENAGLSQEKVGAKLSVSQQTYNKFVNGNTGASYMTATHIARLVGFEGVDAFFLDRGVSVPGQKRSFTDRLPKREIAAQSLMKEGRVSAAAYEAVRDDPEYNRPEHEFEDSVFWRIVLEAAERIMSRSAHDDPEPKSVEKAPRSARKRGAA